MRISWQTHQETIDKTLLTAVTVHHDELRSKLYRFATGRRAYSEKRHDVGRHWPGATSSTWVIRCFWTYSRKRMLSYSKGHRKCSCLAI